MRWRREAVKLPDKGCISACVVGEQQVLMATFLGSGA